MPRALVSVYNKEGLVPFASGLNALGWDLVASGGTEKTLQEAGLAVTPLSQVTQSPEMLGGRVKTLHPAIHAGILMRDSEDDLQEVLNQGFAPIDMVICNLYPFQETVAKPNVTEAEAIEQIDIGGVTLLRAAAKNFSRVIVLSDPADYEAVLESLQSVGKVDESARRKLAVKAFAHTQKYDSAIHGWLVQGEMLDESVDELPKAIGFSVHQIESLRYGENPHQQAGYYSYQDSDSPFGAEQLSGKQLSYNNILDVDAAWRTVSSFADATVVIVKHLTPTGIASNQSIVAAFPDALASDPLSAFGGVIAVNREVTAEFVEGLGSLFVEAIAAPAFSPEAQTMLSEKRKNCRVLVMPRPYDVGALDIRSVQGGMLVQRLDQGDPENTVLDIVTERAPTSEELEALRFAWKAVQHIKSNSIVLSKINRTVGVGGGLPSRVDAVKLAIEKAGNESVGAVLASDAFFPFADGLEEAAKAGITAVIQPGGSIRDKQVIEAANQANIAMVFTGVRHFRH